MDGKSIEGIICKVVSYRVKSQVSGLNKYHQSRGACRLEMGDSLSQVTIKAYIYLELLRSTLR